MEGDTQNHPKHSNVDRRKKKLLWKVTPKNPSITTMIPEEKKTFME